MTQKYCTIDEDELKELMAKVAGIQAWIRNDANIGEIQKRVNVLEYLLQKLERKLTKRVPDAGDSAASQTLSPQSGESTPEVDPAATQRR